MPVIYGTIFIDRNGNGLQDSGDPGFPDVTVQVTDSLSIVHNVSTDDGGAWLCSVPSGSTTVDVDNSSFPSSVTISGYVYDAYTGDPLADVTVDYGTGTVATDSNGHYQFSVLCSFTQTAGTDPQTQTVPPEDFGLVGYQPDSLSVRYSKVGYVPQFAALYLYRDTGQDIQLVPGEDQLVTLTESNLDETYIFEGERDTNYADTELWVGIDHQYRVKLTGTLSLSDFITEKFPGGAPPPPASLSSIDMMSLWATRNWVLNGQTDPCPATGPTIRLDIGVGHDYALTLEPVQWSGISTAPTGNGLAAVTAATLKYRAVLGRTAPAGYPFIGTILLEEYFYVHYTGGYLNGSIDVSSIDVLYLFTADVREDGLHCNFTLNSQSFLETILDETVVDWCVVWLRHGWAPNYGQAGQYISVDVIGLDLDTGTFPWSGDLSTKGYTEVLSGTNGIHINMLGDPGDNTLTAYTGMADYSDGETAAGAFEYRTIVEFDKALLPTNSEITSGTLKLYLQDLDGFIPDPAETRVHRLGNGLNLHDIIEDEATWNERKDTINWDTVGGDYDLSSVTNAVPTDGTGQWYEWDVTELATRDQTEFTAFVVPQWGDHLIYKYVTPVVELHVTVPTEEPEEPPIEPTVEPPTISGTDSLGIMGGWGGPIARGTVPPPYIPSGTVPGGALAMSLVGQVAAGELLQTFLPRSMPAPIVGNRDATQTEHTASKLEFFSLMAAQWTPQIPRSGYAAQLWANSVSGLAGITAGLPGSAAVGSLVRDSMGLAGPDSVSVGPGPGSTAMGLPPSAVPSTLGNLDSPVMGEGAALPSGIAPHVDMGSLGGTMAPRNIPSGGNYTGLANPPRIGPVGALSAAGNLPVSGDQAMPTASVLGYGPIPRDIIETGVRQLPSADISNWGTGLGAGPGTEPLAAPLAWRDLFPESARSPVEAPSYHGTVPVPFVGTAPIDASSGPPRWSTAGRPGIPAIQDGQPGIRARVQINRRPTPHNMDRLTGSLSALISRGSV